MLPRQISGTGQVSSSFSKYVNRLNRNREVLPALVVDDFRDQYRGAVLGLLWAFLRPAAFIVAIWMVVGFGLKGTDLIGDETPFILHLLCGYLPWLLFTESVTGSMNSIVGNRFLLRQTSFQPSMFPIIKFCSALFLHGVFLLLLLGILLAHGYTPTLYWIQVPLLLALLLALVLGLGWLTSSLRLFSNDVAQVVSVVLQVGFWLTPIFWSLSRLPDEARQLAALNPMAFIVEGYRDALLREIWIWQKPEEMVIYLAGCVAICFAGGFVFKRLRPHFGEMI